MTNYIEKLEFNIILKSISNYCTLFLAKNMAYKIIPSSEIDEINNMQIETNDARKLIEQGDSFSFEKIQESKIFNQDIPINEIININDIYQLNNFLKECNHIKKLLTQNKKNDSISKHVVKINDLSELINLIDLTINENIEIKSSASTTLKKLRKKSLAAYEKLNKDLNKVLSNKDFSNYFQSDSIRHVSGRLALEIKSEFKTKFKGIIHGSSSSNNTTFIEPISTVDICNQWNDYQNQIREEEIQILKNISNEIIDAQSYIKENVELASKIDLIFAKAKYSKEIEGNIILKEKNSNRLRLIDCKHPLLGKDAVPINLEINDDETTIIISGPNAGGKTVSLKTLGLSALMSQSGIQVPCSFDSKLPIFSDFFVHIGDEQDLDKSESSFSSHISNIISTIENCDKKSLILIDEIVSSTDPDEGLALACAITNYLNNKKCKTVITTHIKGLVEYGNRQVWSKNYSVLFNSEKNLPTYRLIEGIESNSFAIATSRNLGLQEEIIQEAEKNLDNDYLQYRSLIEELNAERNKLNKIQGDLKNKEKELKSKQSLLENEISKLKIEKQKIIEEHIADQKKELSKFKKEIKSLKQSINSTQEIKDTKKIIRNYEKKFQTNENINNAINLKLGDLVKLEGISSPGKLIGFKSKKIGRFSIGNSVLELPIDKALSIIEDKRNNENFTSLITESNSLNYELDLRGFSVIDIKDTLEKFLDNSLLNNEKSCQIFHGIGSRSVESEVHRILRETNFIKSYSPHKDRKGVTVVNFK